MADIQILADALHALAHALGVLLQGVLALVILWGVIAFAALIIRNTRSDGSIEAASARARVEAELALIRRQRAPAPSPLEDVLRRKLRAVEAVIAASPFEGEREAAEEARRRLIEQLEQIARGQRGGQDDNPEAPAPEGL